jgi:DhnA family fructose-bisphosphate aldolase class Ia
MPAPPVSSGEPSPTAAEHSPSRAYRAPDHQAGPAIGHGIRMRRILNPADGKTVIVPFDHGMIFGPLHGIANPRETVTHALAGHADAVLLHAGLARGVADLYGGRMASLFKLTNGASIPTDQVLLGSVEQAARYAADAVCAEFYLGGPDELDTLRTVGLIQREAEQYGLPTVVHAYVYPAYEQKIGVGAWIHACRIAGELGADIVKTAYIDNQDAFVALLEATPAPVVVAGGEPGGTRKLLSGIATAIRLGASGVAVGRGVWGSPDPTATLCAIRALVHDGAAVDDVMARFHIAEGDNQ